VNFLIDKIGRTWLSAMIVWTTATILFVIGKLDIGTWKEISFVSVGIGGLKSTVLGGIERYQEKKGENQNGKSTKSNS
jgi:hypothetical protein